ncbi:MAG: nucleoside-diphosphate kinase [Flavobacteriaceae bacterium]|nr:nucleoside-diphosphate kinase [Flavobacteriaceae bacterium]
MSMKTFFMIKPDGVQRNLIGQIISRVEVKGFNITKIKMMTISKELAEEHYEEHKGKQFFNDLVSFITSGPVVAMQVEGEDVVLQIRNIMGATNPNESTPGSIRGDLATELDKNVVHGSDSDESAERELSLFFGN